MKLTKNYNVSARDLLTEYGPITWLQNELCVATYGIDYAHTSPWFWQPVPIIPSRWQPVPIIVPIIPSRPRVRRDPADYPDGFTPAILGLGDICGVPVGAGTGRLASDVREITEDAVSNVERVEDLAMDLALFAHDQHATIATYALARTIARELPDFLKLCQRITA